MIGRIALVLGLAPVIALALVGTRVQRFPVVHTPPSVARVCFPGPGGFCSYPAQPFDTCPTEPGGDCPSLPIGGSMTTFQEVSTMPTISGTTSISSGIAHVYNVPPTNDELPRFSK